MHEETRSVGAIVIGGGQSGLAAAYHLTRRSVRCVVLEAGDAPTGSWQRYYDSLTLFSPARHSALPGLDFPGEGRRYPARDEVAAYLRRYAAVHGLEVEVRQPVTAVYREGSDFLVETARGHRWEAPIVIAATGSYSAPHRPALPGMEVFEGPVVHSSEYGNPGPYTDQRVLIVGGGNSAVQIAHELSGVAQVTLVSRAPIRFFPQRPLGVDLHDWLRLTRLDRIPLGRWRNGDWAPKQPVLDHGAYKEGVAAGRPRWRPMFTRLEADHAVWEDGTRAGVDAIILATGFRPAMPFLAPIGAVDEHDRPIHRAGLSRVHAGLGFVGLEGQRSAASATLRGVGRDADFVVGRLLARVRAAEAPRRCCQRVAA